MKFLTYFGVKSPLLRDGMYFYPPASKTFYPPLAKVVRAGGIDDNRPEKKKPHEVVGVNLFVAAKDDVVQFKFSVKSALNLFGDL